MSVLAGSSHQVYGIFWNITVVEDCRVPSCQPYLFVSELVWPNGRVSYQQLCDCSLKPNADLYLAVGGEGRASSLYGLSRADLKGPAARPFHDIVRYL